ncbi:hypothetical protein NHX12_020569, partial [Muraenolepis orangiensis]
VPGRGAGPVAGGEARPAGAPGAAAAEVQPGQGAAAPRRRGPEEEEKADGEQGEQAAQQDPAAGGQDRGAGAGEQQCRQETSRPLGGIQAAQGAPAKTQRVPPAPIGPPGRDRSRPRLPSLLALCRALVPHHGGAAQVGGVAAPPAAGGPGERPAAPDGGAGAARTAGPGQSS